ncbi:MAG TPA: hypothetical protein VFN09_08170 [Rhodanobacteraceae bacterium]|nr:hypothetical protein [Rhodanobacteraceae bacterium]
MQYNHALVLYALNERDKALTALQSAVDDSPKLLAWLLKDKPRPPRLDPIGFTLGGDDEAWFYRQETLSLWEQLGALDWLRSCAKAIKRRK